MYRIERVEVAPALGEEPVDKPQVIKIWELLGLLPKEIPTEINLAQQPILVVYYQPGEKNGVQVYNVAYGSSPDALLTGPSSFTTDGKTSYFLVKRDEAVYRFHIAAN